MPPSLSYWQPEGSYTGNGDVSKTLLFSAWNVAPDAVATLLSYEVERLMTKHITPPVSYDDIHPPKTKRKKRFPQRLRFAVNDGQVTGLTALALMYPSPSLAELVDPLAIALKRGWVKRHGLSMSTSKLKKLSKRQFGHCYLMGRCGKKVM